MTANLQSDFESFERVVGAAAPARRIEALREVSREGIRWHTVKGLPKADIVDRLYTIGRNTGMEDNAIQEALAGAIANPFTPKRRVEAAAPTGNPTARLAAALVVRRASEIQPQEIDWLWPGRIAIGKLTILAGEPGLGKSQLTCSVSATATKGGRWPGNEGSARVGSVIILAAEDDAADTIRPRLDAAGADSSKVYIVSAVRSEDGKGRRSFNLQADLELLEAEINRIGDVTLVIIDPVSSYLGKVDSHRNAELRAVLEPIGEMAARLGVAVLAITHLNKSNGGGSANSRFIGSIAFVAAARAAFIVCRDPADNERRLFLPSKNNIGPEGSGLGFRVGAVQTPSGILAPAVFWDTLPVTVTANEALNGSQDYGSAPARTEAEDFLRAILEAGSLPVKKIEEEAKAAGLSWSTVERAKATLGVKAAKAGVTEGWSWALPEEAQP